MNISKRVLTAVAAATAVATLSAAAVGAIGLGFSEGDIVESNSTQVTEDADTSVELSDATVTVTVPAGTFDVDWVDFHVDVIENADVASALESLKSDTVAITASKVLDLYFTDHATGDVIDVTDKGIVVSIKTTDQYNTLYYYNPETKALEDVNASFSDNVVTFTAPHLSTYVLAEIEDNGTPAPNPSTPDGSTSAPEGKPGNNGVLTGDNSAMLIVIVSAVAVAALATVVVATKAKKSSK